MPAPHSREPSDRLLLRALTANAVFSAVTGLALLAAAGPLARAFGVAEPLVLRLVGGALVPFAAFVAFVARGSRPGPASASSVRLISALDAGWVVATLALAILWPGALNGLGWGAAVAVAAVVEACCIGQLFGLRRVTLPRPAAA